MNEIKVFESQEQESTLLENSIKKIAKNDAKLQIMEAGCGRCWPLSLDDVQYVLTGVDTDKKALDFRQTVTNDLDNAILGDLRSVKIRENGYDVIYTSFVLEHVKYADRVLDNFSNWLKPGGLLIMRIPDRNSVYGLITRLTPFWVHVMYKKYIKGLPNAGKPGHGPYPTFSERVVSRDGVHKYCQSNDYVIKEEYGLDFYMRGRGVIPILTRMFVTTIGLLSFGKLAWKHNNLTFILEKQ